MSNGHRPLVAAIAGDFRSSWKELVLTDIAYKIVAFVLLTPLVGILFRVLVGVSGRVVGGKAVLADQDILHFMLGPVGWVCFIAVGGLWLGIVALEQATLMGIVAVAGRGERLPVSGALRFAAANGRPVVLVAAKMLALTLLTAAPFLAVVGLAYFLLLGSHDINYYLTDKPVEFWVAIGLGGVLVAGLLAVLLRLATSWFFALPLVLFEGVRPSAALQVSCEKATGHRLTLLLWVGGWAVASMALSGVASSMVVLLGRFFVPRAAGSPGWLFIAVGGTLLLWAGVNLAVNLLGSTTFATMLWHLYRRLACRGEIDLAKLNTAEATGGRIRFTWTSNKLLGMAVVGILLAAAIGGVAIRTVRLEDHTEITAHRGASADAPENTMAAVRQAIEDRADWVEIDVQETADGEVVVFHDSDFMKLAGVDLKIWDATMADLEKIDVGGRFHPKFKNERVPTLDEVLAECKGKVGVNIELKYYGHDKQLEQRVVDIVEAHRMESSIVVMSLKKDAVKKMKTLRPEWKVGLLTSVAIGDLTKVDADFLAVSTDLATRRFIRSAHNSKKEVHVWTVNDVPTMSTMMGRGVDSLITDKPALARTVLQRRAKMSPPERLMLGLAGILGVEPEIHEQ